MISRPADVRLTIVKKYGRPINQRTGTLTSEPVTGGMVGPTRGGWIRVEIGADGPVCELVGTNRRRLVVRSIPLGTATALMARGVPSVVRHSSLSRPVSAHT